MLKKNNKFILLLLIAVFISFVFRVNLVFAESALYTVVEKNKLLDTSGGYTYMIKVKNEESVSEYTLTKDKYDEVEIGDKVKKTIESNKEDKKEKTNSLKIDMVLISLIALATTFVFSIFFTLLYFK